MNEIVWKKINWVFAIGNTVASESSSNEVLDIEYCASGVSLGEYSKV